MVGGHLNDAVGLVAVIMTRWVVVGFHLHDAMNGGDHLHDASLRTLAS